MAQQTVCDVCEEVLPEEMDYRTVTVIVENGDGDPVSEAKFDVHVRDLDTLWLEFLNETARIITGNQRSPHGRH